MVSTMTCWDYLLTSYFCSCWFSRMADKSCQEDKSLYGLLRDGLLIYGIPLNMSKYIRSDKALEATASQADLRGLSAKTKHRE